MANNPDTPSQNLSDTQQSGRLESLSCIGSRNDKSTDISTHTPLTKPKIFISRTTKGLSFIALKVAAVLEEKGFEIVHQPDFGMGWRKIRHMLMDKIRNCDSVLCLIGPAYGIAPRQNISEFTDPDTERTEFSYTQIEYLLARRLHKPVITILLSKDFPLEGFEQTDHEERLQREFIQQYIFNKEHLYQTYSAEDTLLDELRRASLPISCLPPATPENIPTLSIGTLFTGREDALNTIRDNLLVAQTIGKTRPIQVIHGMGGVGKTRLAVEFAHAHRNDYNACLFLRGDTPGALEDSLAQLSGFFVLNLEEQDEQETEIRIQAVLRWLETHPGYLLVIDNVDSEETRDFVVELIPRFRHGHVLITSRLHTWPGDILRQPLEVLSDSDGAALILGYRASPKMPADTDVADALNLAQDLDGLALALEQAAAYLNSIACTIAEYHELWRENSQSVLKWHDPGQMDYPASVATTWLTSFDQLYPSDQTLLRLLSWLAPDPIPNSFIRTLDAKRTPEDPLEGASAAKALGALINFSLAKACSGGRAFTVHRLVQQITRERQLSMPIPKENAGTKPAGFFKLLFSGKTDNTRPDQTAFAPVALTVTLDLVNGEFDDHSDDIRNWPVLVPLLPHALAVADFAALQHIPAPTVRLLSVSALLLHAQANHRAAEPIFRRALALDEKNFGDKHPNVASILGNLAQLLVETARSNEAESLMQRALRIDETYFGKKHPKVAVRLNNLAQLLVQTDRNAEAEPMMQRALAIDEAWFGPGHPNVAIRLSNLAQLFADTGRGNKAEALMRRALEIDEKKLGQDHPNVAIRLNNLGQLLQNTDRLDEAEVLMERALAIDEAAFGKDHPNVAIRLCNLAQLFQETNRLKDAEPMMRRALDIDERNFFSEHPKITTDLDNLAQLLQATNRPEEAEQLMRRALEINEKRLGKDDHKIASALHNIALLLQSTNRLEEAESLMRRALEIYERRFGTNHPKVARVLSDLGQLLQDDDRLSEAEALMHRAFKINELNLGPNDPEIALDLNNLALLFKASNRPIEAVEYMRRAFRLDQENFPPDHPNVVMDMKNLSLLLMDASRPEEAEPLLRSALVIDEQRYGTDYPDVASDCILLAKCLLSLNRFVESEQFISRALEINSLNSVLTGYENLKHCMNIDDYTQLMSIVGLTEDQIRDRLNQAQNKHLQN